MSKAKSTVPDLDGIDDLFYDAVDVVLQAKKASTAYLQRRLRVGYSRAARIMDLLEEQGVIGEQVGTKPRKVYIRVAKKLLKTHEDEKNKPKKRDTNKNKTARTKKAVKEADIELIEPEELTDPTKEGLSPMEEAFCELYVSPTEFYGNGTQSYIEAFDVTVVKGKSRGEESEYENEMTYDAVRQAAYKLLTNTHILTRINELLEEGGLNDQFIDKQLKHLITQHADPRVQLAAITEYNKLKARIVSNVNNIHSFANEDMTDAELLERIEKNKKFFEKK